MMIELRSREQMARAIERARQIKPFVRVGGWRWYEVTSSDGATVYTIHFYGHWLSGRLLGECNCLGAGRGFVCYRLGRSGGRSLGNGRDAEGRQAAVK